MIVCVRTGTVMVRSSKPLEGECIQEMVESAELVNSSADPSIKAFSSWSPPPQRKRHQKIKMGMSKDTSDLKGKSKEPLKSCILVSKEDGSGERISINKAKSVHFADSLGKPLNSVQTLFDYDEDFDLSFLSIRSTTRRTFPVDIFKRNNTKFGCVGDHNKLINFKQPVTTSTFQSRVEKDNVCLENVVFRDYGIFATVTVKNISFEKQITVRYTLNKWQSHDTVIANYVPGSSTGNGLTDTFSFEIIPEENDVKEIEIQFAICYNANGQTYWDSNHGNNYILLFQRKQQNDKLKQEKNVISTEHSGGFILSRQNFIGWST